MSLLILVVLTCGSAQRLDHPWFKQHLKQSCPSDIASHCENNATCQGNALYYRCVCADGYIGHYCETENPCINDPCKRGQCTTSYIGSGHGYIVPEHLENKKCCCPRGYWGDLCEKRSPCFLNNTLCENGGRCIPHENEAHGFFCRCSFKFFGMRCEKEDPCINNRCIRGQCTKHFYWLWLDVHDIGNRKHLENKTCSCPVDYWGDLCEKRSPCFLSNKLCENGGRCHTNELSVNGFSCNCSSNFWGERCEKDSPCITDPNLCMNNGTCRTNQVNGKGYYCDCARNYFGQNCSQESPCITGESPCQNNGTCVYSSSRGMNGYYCRCPQNYSNKNCTSFYPPGVPLPRK